VKRSPVLVLLAVLVVLLAAPPAAAGGGAFSFGQGSYRPGDQAYAWADVYDADEVRAQGPFAAWLVPESDAWVWGEVPAGAVYVGDLTLHVGDHPSNLVTGAWVDVTFTVPDLAPGSYTIVECNHPCTAGIADITGRHPFTVPGPAAPATTAAPAPTAPPTTTATPATTPSTATTTTEVVAPLVAEDGGGRDRLVQVGLGLGGGLLLAAVVWLGWGRRQPTTKPA